MDLADLPFPDPPASAKDPELWLWLAQFEFVRWLRNDYEDAYVQVRDKLIKQIDRVVQAIQEQDPLFRWRAAYFAAAFYREQRIDLILNVLNDADSFVRAQMASHSISIRHASIEGRLVELLITDSSPDVRAAACYGLVGQDPLAAIPILLRALGNDHASNENGHRVSSCAANALDEIMGTEITAKRSDGIETLPDEPPDLELLRQQANEHLLRLKLDRK